MPANTLEDILPSNIRYPQEMKCPVCILLDTSGSMSGQPIAELNKGVQELKKVLLNDDKAKKIVELCVITFGDNVTPLPVSAAEDFHPDTFIAGGGTPMGAAILKGFEILEKRKEQYKMQGVHKYRPWLIIITDGAPTDMTEGDDTWNEATHLIRETEANKKVIAWAFGVSGANLPLLNALLGNNGRVYSLEGYNFTGLFQWLSDSIAIVSRSKEGEHIKIDTPPAQKIELEI